jgi:fatty acid desaturase
MFYANERVSWKTTRAPLRARLSTGFRRVHGPTWLVAFAIYAGWGVLTWAHAALPIPLLVVLGGVVVAWHGSLQHETIHGHPAGSPWIGRVLGAPPLALWLPYEIYRETHQRHHATAHLTDPAHDPESPFMSRERWATVGPLRRALAVTLRTGVGRLVLGPPITALGFLFAEMRAAPRWSAKRRRAWAVHALSVCLVVAWVLGVAHMPLWKYLALFVYPGMSLTLLRSFVEHRADVSRSRRTTVIETSLFFRLLFLNNNLHVVHHRAPRVPWFELPPLWERERATVFRRSAELIYPGYLGILWRYAFRPISRVDGPPEAADAASFDGP